MILITRPAEDASLLAKALYARGYETFIEPLLDIVPATNSEKPLKAALKRRPQAIIATSRHALTALASLTQLRDIPILAVGEATARCAQELGFTATICGNNARALAQHVTLHISARTGPLLYIRGANISTDITAILAGHSFEVISVILYKSVRAQKLSPSLQKALREKRIRAALFFSARTAATYAKLVMREQLQALHSNIAAICISTAVTQPLQVLPWEALHFSARPTMNSMLEMLESSG
jgi:uroporphyrinogen-III synthase